MKVILLEDVPRVGRRDQVLEVSRGYARNYLLPRKLAVEATAANLGALEKKLAGARGREARETDAARELASRLESLTITLKARSGEGGKLFGSITARDIADAAARALGTPIDKRQVELDEPLRALGSHSVPVRLHRDVTPVLRVEIVEESGGAQG